MEANLDDIALRLKEQKENAQRISTGQQILLTFYRNHPELKCCAASDKVIEDYLRSQGKADGFSLQTLEEGVATFGPGMAKAAPVNPTPHVPPVEEPAQPARLVPYSRRELLHLDPDTFKALYQQSPEHLTQVNKILNQGRL
jgi:hypothetical protein